MSKARTVEFDVELQEPLTVSVAGQQVEANVVLLKAPSAKNRRPAFGMKQIVLRAIKEQQSMASTADMEKARSQAEKDDSDPTGSEIIMLVMASNENFDLFNDQFKEIICNGCAEISGVAMTAHLYDKLCLDDAEKLLSEYLEHFLMKSLLQ